MKTGGYAVWPLAVLLSIALLLAALTGKLPTKESVPKVVRIATAARGGLYHQYGSLIGQRLQRRTGAEVRLIETKGSEENYRLLISGEAEIALLQSGSTPTDGLASVAPLYRDMVHLIVRRDLGIDSIFDFNGRPILLGPKGSGMQAFAHRLLDHFKIQPAASPHTESYFLSLVDQPALDGAVVTTGSLNPDLQKLLEGGAYRLLPTPFAEALAMRYPYMEPATIPTGLFRVGEEPVPSQPVSTVATVCFLAVREDASGEMVRQALESLYHEHLLSESSILIGKEEALRWNWVEPHPAAKAWRDPYSGLGKLGALTEQLAALKELLFAFGAGLYLVWRRTKRAQEVKAAEEVKRQKELLDGYLDRTVAIERAQMDVREPAQLEGFLNDVTQIKLEAIEKLSHEDLRGDRVFSIFLLQCANLIRKIQSKIELAAKRE